MKKYVVLGMLVLMITASLDAAPRNRRRARRQSRRATKQTTNVRYQTQPVTRAVPTSNEDAVQRASLEETPVPDALRLGDALPTVAESTGDVMPASAARSTIKRDAVATATESKSETINAALAELNAQRTRRGLRPFVEDPRLTVIAQRKATIQANRGYVGHPGGTMGGARFEGVGMGPNFITCYQYATNATYAGAASVSSRNGRRYHCLLLR